MSASVLAIALRKPVIPFKPVIPHDSYQTITLYREINVGTAAAPHFTKQKEEAFHFENTDIEYLLRTIHEFEDIVTDDRLQLNTGPLRFTYFRKCLGGTARDNWDLARHNRQQDLNGFNATMTAFITKYISASDFLDQKHYLENFEKPHSLSPRTAADRLVQMNTYMKMMPGSNDTVPWDDTALKLRLFSIMRAEWRLNFTSSGHELNDQGMTYARLITYFEGQHKISTARYQAAKSRTPPYSDGTNGPPAKRQRNDFHPSKPCPYHNGTHIWLHCFGNPNGPNYRPNFVLPALPPAPQYSGPPMRSSLPPSGTMPRFHIGQPSPVRSYQRNNGGYRNDRRGQPSPVRSHNRPPPRHGNFQHRNGQRPPRNNNYQRCGQDGHFHDDYQDETTHDYDQHYDGQANQYYQDYPPPPWCYDDSYNSRGYNHNDHSLPPPPPAQAPPEPSTPPPQQQSQHNQDPHWLDNFQY